MASGSVPRPRLKELGLGLGLGLGSRLGLGLGLGFVPRPRLKEPGLPYSKAGHAASGGLALRSLVSSTWLGPGVNVRVGISARVRVS